MISDVWGGGPLPDSLGLCQTAGSVSDPADKAEAPVETPAETASGPAGSFQADVSDDVVRAALESVQRHSGSAHAAREPANEPTVEATSVEALEKELAEVRATLEVSAQRARETLERLKETHERHLRAAADLDNYKKRALREREEAEKFGVTKLLKELLPVLDNLDRALEFAGTEADGSAGRSLPIDEGPLKKGVEATRRLFEDTLGKFGVKAFSANGEPFDPMRHEAMQQIPTDEVPPGTVVREVLRGYLLHDRLIRPALVAVAAAAPKTAPVPPTSESTDAAPSKENPGEAS